jgi:predicted ester cyclase
MSTDENKAIARRFLEAWATDDLSVIDELAAPNFTVSYPYFHDVHQKESLEGLEEFKQAIVAFQSTMSDLAIVSEDDIIAEDDKVVIRWTGRGTYIQDPFGLEGVSIIGKSVTWAGVSIYRIVDGKVVEEIGFEDYMTHMRQLGIVSTGWKQSGVDSVDLPGTQPI